MLQFVTTSLLLISSFAPYFCMSIDERNTYHEEQESLCDDDANNSTFTRQSNVDFSNFKCDIIPQIPEGPYYLMNDPERSIVNKHADAVGFPLRLKLTFRNALNCKLLKGATVHIWNANGMGVYSGYRDHEGAFPRFRRPTSSTKGNFLRGYQITNGKGQVTFDTVVPRWYYNRCMHVHIAVFINCDEVYTGNLFFSESFQKMIQKYPPYSNSDEVRVSNEQDLYYPNFTGIRTILDIKGSPKKGFYSEFTFNIASINLN